LVFSSKIVRSSVALLIALMATLVALQAATASRSRTASTHMLVGIYDEGQTLYGDHSYSFPTLQELHAQIIRSNLYWGGKYGVGNTKPAAGADPTDPAYDWSLYDAEVGDATKYGMKVLLSIFGTPSWANKGAGANVVPTNPTDLRKFAQAAATHFPQVKYWLAWNEPNNPVFLKPQYKRVAGKWVVQSAVNYAKICNAVVTGVHAAHTGAKVACGVTSPRGNNAPQTSRPSVSPLAFMRAMKRYGAKGFDAYAHHPYPQRPSETPTTKPGPNAITMANLSSLTKELTRLYGNKPVWITEYAYQTNPPDKVLGVTPAKQATYLKKAFAMARANPRVQMMIWFLFQDDVYHQNGFDWESGFLTQTGQKKPSFTAFASLPH
jgi:hypothetical protein